MRSFSPATWLLIGFLLALASCSAFAETIPSTASTVPAEYNNFHPTCGVCSGNYSSESEAASAAQSQILSAYPYTSSCSWNKTQGEGGGFIAIYQMQGTNTLGNACEGGSGITASAYCSSGTLSGSSCIGARSCPSGYTISEDQLSCTKADCRAGTKVKSGMFTDTNGDGVTPRACIGGCWADFKGVGPYNHYSFNSQIYDSVYIGDYVADGQTCSDSTPVETPVTSTPEQTQPVDTPEYECASQGMTSGTVNGVVVCMPAGTPDAPPVTSPDKIQQQNPDGSKTQTENRDTVDGDSVTRETTTTQYDSNGNVIGQTTSSTTGSLGAFCEQNPNSAVCSESNVTGGGTCDAAPVCKGDAATCAILRQQWEARCEIKKQNDFIGEAGDDGVFESKTEAINAKKTELGNLIDQIRGEAAGLFTFSGAGTATLGCDAGVTTTQGFHVELCFSKYDDELQMIGAVLVFVSLVIAVFIMFS